MEQPVNPVINYTKCNRCGDCITLCPENALRLGEIGPVFIHPTTCTYCTLCEAICPEHAIRAPLTISWAAAGSSTPHTDRNLED